MRNRPHQDPAPGKSSDDKEVPLDQPPMSFDPQGHMDMAAREAAERASGVPRIPGGAEGVVGPAVAATARQQPQGTASGAQAPKRYRVTKDGAFVQQGARVNLRAGKEVSDKDYDIAGLRRAGVLLEEIPPVPGV